MAAPSHRLTGLVPETEPRPQRKVPLIEVLDKLHYRRDSKLSHGALPSDNAIVHGDNLELLKALRGPLAGTFQCIYLDPPYNNQETYNHYKDDLCHEVWLDEIAQRLVVLHDLLSQDGSLWISIDDREMHYLKVHADTIFNRSNFVSTIVWQHRTTRENRRTFSNNHEYILVYAKDANLFKRKRQLLAPSDELVSRYRNPDNDPRGVWQSVSANVQGGHGTARQFYKLVGPTGREYEPPHGRCWVYSEERMQREIAMGNIWFGNDGNGVPRLKLFLNSRKLGLTPQTLWTSDEVGTTDEAKKQIIALFPDEAVFDTPKPEGLISRILEIATEAGDYVLDPYLGSGTTTAVAHKMGRHYLGIERGSHALTLCADRMKQVALGAVGGISTMTGWAGDAGFAFYRPCRNRL